jgi:hypothetical protein
MTIRHAAATAYAGDVDTSAGPRPYCTSDSQAAEALARRRVPPPAYTAPEGEGHLVDRMWHRCQLNDRQHSVAVRLYRLFRKAGLEPAVVADLGERREAGGEMDSDASEARTIYNRVLAQMRGRRADLLHSLCLGIHPGTWLLASLQEALGDVEKPLKFWMKEGVDGRLER